MIESIEKQIEKSKETDDEEDENDGFIDDESTSKDELENFEQWAKNQAKQSLRKHKDLTSLIQIEDLRNLIIKLNAQQRKILDDFCERFLEDKGNPIHLYIAGEAGTGKSFLVKIMIEASNI